MYDSLIKTILTVDDDEDYRSIIQESLETIGYSCKSAADAFEAAKMMAQQPPIWWFQISGWKVKMGWN